MNVFSAMVTTGKVKTKVATLYDKVNNIRMNMGVNR